MYRALMCAAAGAIVAAALCAPTQSAESSMEEIYVVRSVREAQGPATEFCAKARTGLDNLTDEGRFTLQSVATRASDGRVLDANAKTIGNIRLCGGSSTNPAIYLIWGEFVVESIAFKGVGNCNSFKGNVPERGLTVYTCLFDLSGLPDEYASGQLTTNSLSSTKPNGTETKPGGYTQVSIATIRLWKKRDAR